MDGSMSRLSAAQAVNGMDKLDSLYSMSNEQLRAILQTASCRDSTSGTRDGSHCPASLSTTHPTLQTRPPATSRTRGESQCPALSLSTTHPTPLTLPLATSQTRDGSHCPVLVSARHPTPQTLSPITPRTRDVSQCPALSLSTPYSNSQSLSRTGPVVDLPPSQHQNPDPVERLGISSVVERQGCCSDIPKQNSSEAEVRQNRCSNTQTRESHGLSAVENPTVVARPDMTSNNETSLSSVGKPRFKLVTGKKSVMPAVSVSLSSEKLKDLTTMSEHRLKALKEAASAASTISSLLEQLHNGAVCTPVGTSHLAPTGKNQVTGSLPSSADNGSDGVDFIPNMVKKHEGSEDPCCLLDWAESNSGALLKRASTDNPVYLSEWLQSNGGPLSKKSSQAVTISSSLSSVPDSLCNNPVWESKLKGTRTQESSPLQSEAAKDLTCDGERESRCLDVCFTDKDGCCSTSSGPEQICNNPFSQCKLKGTHTGNSSPLQSGAAINPTNKGDGGSRCLDVSSTDKNDCCTRRSKTENAPVAVEKTNVECWEKEQHFAVTGNGVESYYTEEFEVGTGAVCNRASRETGGKNDFSEQTQRDYFQRIHTGFQARDRDCTVNISRRKIFRGILKERNQNHMTFPENASRRGDIHITGGKLKGQRKEFSQDHNGGHRAQQAVIGKRPHSWEQNSTNSGNSERDNRRRKKYSDCKKQENAFRCSLKYQRKDGSGVVRDTHIHWNRKAKDRPHKGVHNTFLGNLQKESVSDQEPGVVRDCANQLTSQSYEEKSDDAACPEMSVSFSQVSGSCDERKGLGNVSSYKIKNGRETDYSPGSANRSPGTDHHHGHRKTDGQVDGQKCATSRDAPLPDDDEVEKLTKFLKYFRSCPDRYNSIQTIDNALVATQFLLKATFLAEQLTVIQRPIFTGVVFIGPFFLVRGLGINKKALKHDCFTRAVSILRSKSVEELLALKDCGKSSVLAEVKRQAVEDPEHFKRFLTG